MTSHRSFSSYLVTPSELSEALKKNPPSKISTSPRTVALCSTWFLPTSPLNGLQTFREKRIPSSRFFDLDKVSDKRSPYPHMLPDAKTFASAMSALGIRRDDTVVVYDSHEQGLFKGYPTESGEFWDVDTCVYPIPQLDESKVADFEEVCGIIKDTGKEGAEGVQILDARSYGRWAGKDPEPRAGMASGHMKDFVTRGSIKEDIESKGVDPTKPVVSSCGTGVTATIIDAALAEAYGEEGVRKIYDGSWTEFAQRSKISDGLIVKEE
ncbi:hypothetical protein DID88_000026 [Monilinia fructigena]|uniref:Rhodanese domain-containing protein n=1 Tax=Monilinia fructigena TaxID=38457 RepID=A0A395IJ63_9HELO|nr:hypothetical protein DID88_000026 [Monilinia fructigena]